MNVKDLRNGDKFMGQLLVVSINKGVNTNHTPYLSMELRDSTGSITAKKWNATSEDDDIFIAGNVIFVRGDVLEYKDNPQIHITEARSLALEEIDASKFVKAPPVDKEILIKEFNEYITSIGDEDCQKLIKYFLNKFKDNFYTAPAATSIHHEFSSGLLMHELTMMKIADALCNIYGNINRDVLLTGTFLHDIGKLVELEGPVIFHYSLQGKLLGHISIMANMVQEAGKQLNIKEELLTILTHMVLAHHGQLEYGSPVLPLTKEALLLSMIDNLDSKVTCLDKALEIIKEGEFTQKIFSLDNRSFYKPKL